MDTDFSLNSHIMIQISCLFITIYLEKREKEIKESGKVHEYHMNLPTNCIILKERMKLTRRLRKTTKSLAV